MGTYYNVGNKSYIDLYVDGRRKRKAIGSRKEAENALTAVKADILRGKFKFKRESKVHVEGFTNDYLKHVRTNKNKSWQRDANSLKFLKAYFGGMLLSKISPRDWAGIRDLLFHDLHHTAATHMAMGGVDLVTVKEILGHATIQMTMRYAHPTPENKRHAVEVLAELFMPAGDRPGHPDKETAQLRS